MLDHVLLFLTQTWSTTLLPPQPPFSYSSSAWSTVDTVHATVPGGFGGLHRFLRDGGRWILRSFPARHTALVRQVDTCSGVGLWRVLLRGMLEGFLCRISLHFSASVHPDVGTRVAGTPGVSLPGVLPPETHHCNIASAPQPPQPLCSHFGSRLEQVCVALWSPFFQYDPSGRHHV